MGEIAGRVIAGAAASWDQPPGFWSEIGDHTLKYAAWGDGYEVTRFAGSGDGWAVLYGRDDLLVGVLTSGWDDVYEQGQQLLAAATPFDRAVLQLLDSSP